MAGMRGAGIARRLNLRLPMENALKGMAAQGLRVDTAVLQSRIPRAGPGCFITARSVKVSSLAEAAPDRALTFSGPGDLVKYILLSSEQQALSIDLGGEPLADGCAAVVGTTPVGLGLGMEPRDDRWRRSARRSLVMEAIGEQVGR